MPIRNTGTLLENIVLLEALCTLSAQRTGVIEFANSFAMPPLAEWRDHRLDAGFSETDLRGLADGKRPHRGSYAELMWACLRQPAASPTTLGPSGALLCALLAARQRTPLRMWLNDLPAGHYGDALPSLGAMNESVREVLALEAAPENVVVACPTPYPLSLRSSAAASLGAVLAAWPGDSVARLGFLDPMRYRVTDPRAGETSSADHRLWLQLLAERCSGPVGSVHFTGHRDWATLPAEVAQMRADGIEEGYTSAVTASHAYYHVVVLVLHPRGEEAAHHLARGIAGSIESQWQAWSCAIRRRRPCTLNVVVGQSVD